MWTGKFIENFKKKAYIIPIILSLFLIPLFFNPSFIYSFTQGKELLFKSIMILTLIAFVPVLIYKRDFIFRNILRSSILLWLILQICIYSITDLFSATPTVTLYGTYSRGLGLIVELFIMFFIVYCSLVLSKETIQKLLKIIFISGIIIAIYAIIQKLGFDPFFNYYDTKIFAGRAFGFSGNPSYLGQLMLLNAIAGGYFIFSEKNKSTKLLFALGTLLIITALFFSGTRTALLGLIVAVILVSIKYFQVLISLIKKYKIAVIVALLLVWIGIAILPQQRYSLSSTALRSLDSRIEIWKGASGLIKKSPILGYGGETFYIYFPEIITKSFLTLEENINISADRIHNEALEIFFSHGVFALIIYLLLFAVVLKVFLKTKSNIMAVLALLIIANIIQNQLAFPDITISILIAFCFSGLIILQSEHLERIAIKITNRKRYVFATLILLFSIFIGITAIYRPYMSQLAYAQSHKNYDVDYAIAINKHKEALSYTPYYSELWYELMFIDPSSMERALFYLEQIEGNSGNVLAWKGNFYADSDPKKATEFYTQALEKNPYHPNWIRAFADMLYKTGDYANALYLYNKYLEAIPDFWEWRDNLKEHSIVERNSYEAFLKQTPYFWGIIEKINNILDVLKDKK